VSRGRHKIGSRDDRAENAQQPPRLDLLELVRGPDDRLGADGPGFDNVAILSAVMILAAGFDARTDASIVAPRSGRGEPTAIAD
jgi:hypothetical protein